MKNEASAKHLQYITRLISPASSVALLPSGQHLLGGGKAGVRDLITGNDVSIQPHQGNVELDRGHSGIFEILVTINA